MIHNMHIVVCYIIWSIVYNIMHDCKQTDHVIVCYSMLYHIICYRTDSQAALLVTTQGRHSLLMLMPVRIKLQNVGVDTECCASTSTGAADDTNHKTASESYNYIVMWLSSIICLIRWLYLNECMSKKNNHLIGQLPTNITSHDSCQ